MKRIAVDIGAFEKRVTLENETNTADGDGGTTSTFTAIDPGTVWASIRPSVAAMREQPIAGTVQATTTHVVEMRYHASVTTKTRITYGSRYLFVRGVENVNEENVLTRCYCDEVVA
jgi:SPP1 family predicted phage head-tail adaptor